MLYQILDVSMSQATFCMSDYKVINFYEYSENI